MARQRHGVLEILSRSESPCFYDSDAVFEDLQSRYPPHPDYGYDHYSTWRRGVERALGLLQTEDLRASGLKVLEAACGDGMVGYAFAGYGHDVILNDLIDWRDSRTKSIPFVQANLCSGLGLKGDTFDLVCSFNSFEHVENPAMALAELVRVCKQGGLIYLEFGPLYLSPWGLHAFRTIYIPYLQFLFSPLFLETKLNELGICDLGKQQSNLQPLNRWRLADFERLWEECGCETVSNFTYQDDSHVNVILSFPQAFTGQNLTLRDVTTQALYITLRKR